MEELLPLLPVHFVAVAIYFGTAIAISYFISKRILSLFTVVSKLFAVSLFVAIYMFVQKGMIMAIAIAAGPLGLLVVIVINGYLYLFQFEAILYPLLGAGLSWWLAVRLVSKRAEEMVASSNTIEPIASITPAPSTTSIKDWVMLLIALVLVVTTIYPPIKRMVTTSSIIPSVIKNPESCKNVQYNLPQYNCVINSIPEGKTVYDYCDYLPSGNNGEAPLTSSQCNLQRVLMLKDVQECNQLSGRRNAYGNYYKCVANYPGTDLHAQVCQELIKAENLDFTYILNTKCLTKEIAQMKNKQGKTPLFFAETVELQNQLFEYGADPNARQTSGQPVLMVLLTWQPSHGEDPKVVLNLIENLLKNGADPNIVGEPPHKTPLEWVLYNYSTVETAELLVKYGADISQLCKGIDPERNDRTKYISSICPKG